MKRHSKVRRSARASSRGGYTLVELVVASAILMAGVAAAAQMSLAMKKQEEANWTMARGMCLLECSQALYRLGLAPSEVLEILPPDPLITISAQTPTLTVPAALGTIEAVDWQAACTVVPGQADVKNVRICCLRPSIR